MDLHTVYYGSIDLILNSGVWLGSLLTQLSQHPLNTNDDTIHRSQKRTRHTSRFYILATGLLHYEGIIIAKPNYEFQRGHETTGEGKMDKQASEQQVCSGVSV